MFNSWLENRIINKLADRLLPLVSASDVGKSPVVTLGEERGVLILPETVLTKPADTYPSVSADTSDISVGDKLIVTIDDTTKTLEVLAGEISPYVHFDTDFEISIGEDAITFMAIGMETGTEFTAEIYKAEDVAEWSLGSGGGGGGVIYQDITVTESDEADIYDLGISFNDFISAKESNQMYVFIYNRRGLYFFFFPSGFAYSDGENPAVVVIDELIGEGQPAAFSGDTDDDNLIYTHMR